MTTINVRKLRKAKKLNQSEFWTKVGVTQSGGSRYENGRVIPKPVRHLLDMAYGPEKKAVKMFNGLRA